MVWDATPEDGRPILEEIVRQVREYDEQPPPERPEWQSDEEFAKDPENEVWPHGFVRWLHMLREGHASLPEVLPTSVLLAWRDGYRDHPCNVTRFGTEDGLRITPIVSLRCDGCHMAMPGRCEEFQRCPVCGGDRFGAVNLGRVEESDPVFNPARRKGARR